MNSSSPQQFSGSPDATARQTVRLVRMYALWLATPEGTRRALSALPPDATDAAGGREEQTGPADCYDPVFQMNLPFPLARLYARVFQVPGDRERHDYCLYLLEAALKLAASALVSRYRRWGTRSDTVDAALRCLPMASLGHWRDLFRETLYFLGGRAVGDPWAAAILEKLAKARSSDLAGVFATMARFSTYRGHRHKRADLLDLLALLPAYRNAMSGAHGAIKADAAVYQEAIPALLTFARALLENGAVLGGGRLVYAEDVMVGKQGEHRAVWIDLCGPNAIRRRHDGGYATPRDILPCRLYLDLEAGTDYVPLQPFVWYMPGGLLDRVFFINRARTGSGGSQFLCYETGEFYRPGADGTGFMVVRELSDFFSWLGSPERKLSRVEAMTGACRPAMRT